MKTIVHCDVNQCKYWEKDENDIILSHGFCTCEELIIENGCCAQAYADSADSCRL